MAGSYLLVTMPHHPSLSPCSLIPLEESKLTLSGLLAVCQTCSSTKRFPRGETHIEIFTLELCNKQFVLLTHCCKIS